MFASWNVLMLVFGIAQDREWPLSRTTWTLMIANGVVSFLVTFWAAGSEIRP